MKNSFAVIFDVDGTMVNNTAVHKGVWLELLDSRYGMKLSEQEYHDKVHARSNDKIVQNLFGAEASAELIEKIADEKEKLYRKTFAPHLQEITGLRRLLVELEQAGISCGIASNSSKENVDFVLDGLNLQRFFKVAINRDMVKVGKPDPESLLRAANELGYPPERCLVFDDSASGFRACRNAGMKYIAITAGTEEADLKETYDAAAKYADFSAITTEILFTIMRTE
jgi:HAD superfamily hydrolase (TIGR01509 family)